MKKFIYFLMKKFNYFLKKKIYFLIKKCKKKILKFFLNFSLSLLNRCGKLITTQAGNPI